MNRPRLTLVPAMALVGFALTSDAVAQTVVETTQPIVAPEAEVAERSELPVEYWLLLDTSGSMTEERVTRAQQTVREVQAALRPGTDVLRVFGFPIDGFARCGASAPLSPHTGLPRVLERGERPIRPLSLEDVESMEAGRGQSQTTPLWPAVAELLHELQETIANEPNRRHRLLVVTDRGCDARHCVPGNPEPDLNNLRCPISEEQIEALLPQMATERLLGNGVNQIAWTIIDQAASEVPESMLCGRGVDCANDDLTRGTLIPPWVFGDVAVTLPEDGRIGLASRRINVEFSWPVVSVGLDEIRASVVVGGDEDAPVLSETAARFVGLDTPSPVRLTLPVAINPRLTDTVRQSEVRWSMALTFGEGADGANRADNARRTFEVTLPTEYVIVPLAASRAPAVDLPVGSTLSVDITADVTPLTELLGVPDVADIVSRLKIGAVGYGAEVSDLRLEPAINAQALAEGRLVVDVTMRAGRGETGVWGSEAMSSVERVLVDSPDAIGLVIEDRNGWFQFSPLLISEFECPAPCDSSSTCTAACDARCCEATPPPPADRTWILWVLLAMLLGLAPWIWSRRYPDPRGLRLEFEASTGLRSVRLFKEYSPWKQPLSVIPPEATETGASMKARCHRDGRVEVRLDPIGPLRAGNGVPGSTVVVARIGGGKRRNAPSLTFIESNREYTIVDRAEDRT